MMTTNRNLLRRIDALERCFGLREDIPDITTIEVYCTSPTGEKYLRNVFEWRDGRFSQTYDSEKDKPQD